MGSTGTKKVKENVSYTANNKSEQLRIILESNPALNEQVTWIRSEDDIFTFHEIFDGYEGNPTPDFTEDDIKKALSTGKITVYSSKPIIAGNFITPSAMEAASYAGNEAGMYKATIDINDVAWIDETQGQIATKKKIKYSKIPSKGYI